MIIISVALKDIIIDPVKKIDLSTLPEEEAICLLKNAYGFLSSVVNISLQNGMAIIELKEPKKEIVNEALKTYKTGVKAAEQADYQKAIKLFTKVLDTIPEHVEARRNLAMAYLESGSPDKAKELLNECVQIDINNVWSYLLLGNIYAKHDRNYDIAEFYFQKGLSINPKDNILLNNYAALKMEQRQNKEAQDLFEKALFNDPSYPNTYYGLALLHKSMGNDERALALLDKLFEQPTSKDIRSAQVYQQAKNLYVDINREIAEKSYDDLMSYILGHKREVEERTGFPIQIIEDNSLEYVSAIAQMAWKHNRNEHIVRYRKKSPAITPHLIAHEIEHILLENAARSVGRNRYFMTTPKTREYAIRSISDHVYKLQKQGYAEDKISQVTLQMTSGLCNQLFNCPPDMFVEYSVFQKYDSLHPSQIVSINQLYQEALSVFTNEDIKRLTPPFIYRANITLNCASALFFDHLFNNKLDYALPYKSSKVFQVGNQLFDIWKKKINSFSPGDEYEMVDEYAKILKLQEWYEWKPDIVLSANKDNLSNYNFKTELLNKEEPTAFVYCLDALKRFEGRSRDEIFQVASEIGLLGTKGIDYKSPGKTYAIKSIPGEELSGLHLLCLMYVGFKKIEPDLDTGLDFADDYKMALEAYNSRLH
jgi:Tfp pilus assembly protein PilF